MLRAITNRLLTISDIPRHTRCLGTLGLRPQTHFIMSTSTGPTDTTIRRLFALSMNRCAFPNCQTPVLDQHSNTILAEVCHIHARNERGPRYDPKQTDAERHGFDNLILLCGVHHKLIDAPENAHRFSASELIALKARHEGEARTVPMPVVELTDEQLSALQSAAIAYESGSIHNDFRHATFRVGGEGGQMGGGGGGGGILTIVGTTRIPADTCLDGEDGKLPGGGGGGAGAIQYIGRPVDTDDLAHGLRICSLVLANAVSWSGALMNVLGAGWTYIVIPSTPFRVRTLLLLTFEFGDIEALELLRITIQINTPSRTIASEYVIDVEVPSSRDLVKRASRSQYLEFDVTELGIWSITVSSSTHVLGVHHFECRTD